VCSKSTKSSAAPDYRALGKGGLSCFNSGMRWIPFLALLTLGCTTVLYDGPRRPKSEAVIVETNRTGILVLDGKRVSDAPEGRDDQVEILPGQHALGVGLFRAERRNFGKVMYFTQPVTVCLDAQPGHHYLIFPGKVPNGWMPLIRDEGTQQLVDNRCK
jgi:hypothetical protein